MATDSAHTAAKLSPENRSERCNSNWFVPALTVGACLLRIISLGRKSFWTDESVSYFLATTDAHSFWRAIWDHELNMLPYYELLRLWAHLGHSEAALRLFSALLGAATIPLFYLLAKRLFSRRVALIASTLLVLNAGHVSYSQEARGYSMAILLCVLASLFLLRATGLGSSEHDKPSAWDWLAYIVCSSLAVYTHFFALLVVIAHFVALLARGKHRVPWGWVLTSCAAIAATLVPLFWFILRRQTDQLDWVPPLSFTTVSKTFVLLAGNAVALVLYLVLWYLAYRRGLRAEQPGSDARWRYVFLLSWLLVPGAITLVASLHRSVFFARFLIVCLPAAVLLAAAGMDHLRRRTWAFVITAAVSLGGVVYSYTRPPQEDWRSATRYVLAEADCVDTVYLVPEYGHFSFDYYRHSNVRAGCEPGSPHILSSRTTPPPDSIRVWVVVLGPEKLPPNISAHLAEVEAKVRPQYEFSDERRFKLLRVLQFQHR